MSLPPLRPHSSGVRARRTCSLPAEPSSAARARAVLREVLSSTGSERWLDAAELACTEVVTNAVLHAHTGVELTVEVRAEELHVQVRDFSPTLPVQRSYDDHATTGRGMALVAAITHEHGIADPGPSGKTIWFTIAGDPDERSEDELLDAWDDAGWDVGPLLQEMPRDDGVRTVTLVGLPPVLWLAARQHHDALIRELVLYLAEHELPEGLDVDLAAADRARATISMAVVAAVEQAQRDGTARPAVPDGHPSPLPWVPGALDLALDIPPDLGPAFTAMQDTLDVAERLAAAGRLLVPGGLPEIIAVRDWACEQVVAQLAGVAPAPWGGAAQERFETEVHGPAPVSDWDADVVRNADRGVVAADEANRILAISRPLAEVLGWEPDALVGRRVVTLIPPRLREAHVAGFTRHLTTAEAHVIGVPLTLPVLRADGTEVACDFHIELERSRSGRTVYLAWMEPTAIR